LYFCAENFYFLIVVAPVFGQIKFFLQFLCLLTSLQPCNLAKFIVLSDFLYFYGLVQDKKVSGVWGKAPLSNI
jgi:hypothetical protein